MYKSTEKRNAARREAFKDPEVKKRHRDRTLMYKFGITLDQYNQMFANQEGKCLTCDKHQSELTKTLAVDHDHNTGKVRGLLCDFCNRQLGVYESQRKLFNRFDDYLNRPTLELVESKDE